MFRFTCLLHLLFNHSQYMYFIRQISGLIFYRLRCSIELVENRFLFQRNHRKIPANFYSRIFCHIFKVDKILFQVIFGIKLLFIKHELASNRDCSICCSICFERIYFSCYFIFTQIFFSLMLSMPSMEIFIIRFVKLDR